MARGKRQLFSFVILLFLFVFLFSFSSQAAQFVYTEQDNHDGIYSDYTLGYISEDASGKFQKTPVITTNNANSDVNSYSTIGDVVSFTHNGNSRILVYREFDGGVCLYDPADLTKPLMSADGYYKMDDVAVYKNKLLFGSSVSNYRTDSETQEPITIEEEFDKRIAAAPNEFEKEYLRKQKAALNYDCKIIEFDLTTGETKEHVLHKYVANPSRKFFDADSKAIVLNDKIYVIYKIRYSTIDLIDGYYVTTTGSGNDNFVEINEAGEVTGQYTGSKNINISYNTVTISGGEIYFYATIYDHSNGDQESGIYKFKGFSENPEKVVDVETYGSSFNTMYSDGNGGLYYTIQPYSTTLYHWNGSENKKVFEDDNSLNSLYDIVCDSGKLYAVYYKWNDNKKFFCEFTPQSDDSLKITQELEGNGNDNFSVALVSIKPTSNPPASDKPDSKTETNTNQNNQTNTQPNNQSEVKIIDNESVKPEVKNKIASAFGVRSSDIVFLEETNFSDKKEATPAITSAISDDGFTISETLASLSVSEPGYYVMSFSVPSNLRGIDKDIKIYLVSSIVYSSGVNASALPSGITEATLLNSDGENFSQVPETIIAAANIVSAGDYGVYLATATETKSNDGNGNLGSSGGGCNSSFAVSLLALALMALKKK